MGKTKPGFYAVARGRKIGVYLTWDECKAQVNGYTNARFKKFDTNEQAEEFITIENEGAGARFHQINARDIIQQTSKVFSTLAPKDPAWKTKTYKEQNIPQPSSATKSNTGQDIPAYFDRKYSGIPSKPAYRPELGAGSFSLANSLLQDQKKARHAGDSSGSTSSVPKRDISTSATDYRRQLRVTEDRVTGVKRKFGEMSQYSNSMVTNIEKFNVDNEGYVVVYTDGACTANGTNGAKAGIGIWFADNHELNVSEPVIGRQTNNTAEIQAAERAISQAKKAGIDKLCVKTDSQFVINCVTKWLPNWKRNGWKLKNGKPVINKADLEQLIDTMQDMEIKWSYVAGHKGIHGNEQADRLAVDGAHKRLKL